MIELIFVIVILGILASIALPRFAVTRDDAQIAKGRSDVAAIRAGIVNERQTRLLRGESHYVTALENGSLLFENVMQYGIVARNADGHWRKSGSSYFFKVMGEDQTFDYNATSGTFNCVSGSYCSKLTE